LRERRPSKPRWDANPRRRLPPGAARLPLAGTRPRGRACQAR
jgi:hypothetical protein